MNKVIVLTGSIVGVAYLTELFVAWYSGYIYEQYAFYNRAVGPYWWAYAAMMTCNVISPQFFWFRSIRRSLVWTFVLSIVVNIGMWFERFVIIATTLARDYIPSSWSYYSPSWVEMGIYLFTFGLFGTLYLIFMRVAPVVAVAEIKSILKSSGDQYVGPAVAERTGEINAGLHHHDHEEDVKEVTPNTKTTSESDVDVSIGDNPIDKTIEDFKEDLNFEDGDGSEEDDK
jgi:molybdopterin-containing oxidoreductase family membrane subunit